ncbi:MAG: outer membrane protein assembly factor BamC [Burkholderiaceae bacterium]|nr:outer membrane protein assembly factor BamC [Burkholderiaceae bacterium]
MEADRIDYKSAAKSSTPRLEVPPDLTQLQRDNRYVIPSTGTMTASAYNQQQATQPASSKLEVASSGRNDMRIERAGNQRWLVVKRSPEVLWPQIKDFWQDSGFLINVEQPEVGVMETDWAENRAKIPQDLLRKTLGKVLDSLYSTGERDKFRTRLERGANGSTEIYISHRGAQEELVGVDKATTVWTARPSDPELEAEFLSRLMVRLGMDSERAKAVATAKSVSRAQTANLVKGKYVEVNEGFDRAWRRVGLALDRVGFTVEDRDRSKGLYYVRFVGDDANDKSKAAETGFLSRMFTWGSSDKGKTAQRYRISVQSVDTSCRVSVLDNNGHPEKSAVGDKILSLLQEQLK